MILDILMAKVSTPIACTAVAFLFLTSATNLNKTVNSEV